jgi:hypothetical protein
METSLDVPFYVALPDTTPFKYGRSNVGHLCDVCIMGGVVAC